MQPNGNVIVDTICRTAKLGTTITGATENGDVTVIEAEPVEPINECPTCGQPGVFRDHVIRSLVDLPIVGHPTTSCAPSTLPVHQQALLAEDLPCWPCLRARQFKDHGPGDPLDPVSYTHLDVYKRQEHRNALPRLPKTATGYSRTVVN